MLGKRLVLLSNCSIRAQPRILTQRGLSKLLRILEGSGGMLPQEKFESLGVNILNFGEILL